MKKFIVLLVILTSFRSIALSDYQQQFNEQRSQRDLPGMEKTLDDWDRLDPANLELKVDFGQYFYDKGRAIADSRLMRLSLPYWKSALLRDPWRLDVDFALARLYQDLGEFEAQYGLLAQTLQSADKGWRNLRWVGGQKLPKRSSKLIPETLRGYISYYFNLHTPEGDEAALRLARLSITYYPGRSYTYGSIATYFSRRGDWARALKYLLIASLKDPRNSQAIWGIGNILVELGKKKEAGIYYQKVIDLNDDQELVEKAKAKLGVLK